MTEGKLFMKIRSSQVLSSQVVAHPRSKVFAKVYFIKNERQIWDQGLEVAIKLYSLIVFLDFYLCGV